MPTRVLLIGLGNPLREDDGVGAEVVRLLEENLSGRTGINLMAEHQVDLTHAALLQDCEMAVFIDAYSGDAGQPVQIEKMQPASEALAFSSHIGSIPALLALTQKVFARTPECYLVGIQGISFEHGQGLSSECKKNAVLATEAVLQLLETLNRTG